MNANFVAVEEQALETIALIVRMTMDATEQVARTVPFGSAPSDFERELDRLAPRALEE
jgi:hypothetical protein